MISDKINQRIPTLAVSCLLLAFAQFYMSLMPDCDRCYHVVFPLVLYELGLSMFMANVWAALKYFID
jgi:hypothetical protein